eukprot:TsM_000500800 transcript=TsM_000500800 gene=TsM_000500800
MEIEVFRGRWALALPSFVESAVDAVVHSGIATAAVEFFGLQRSKVDQALCSDVYSFPAVELGNIKGGEVVLKQPGSKEGTNGDDCLPADCTGGGNKHGRGETSDQRSQQSWTAADEIVVEQLQCVGFTCGAYLDSCLATASGTDAASRWLMEHLDDCDFNVPIPGVKTSPLAASSATVEMGSLAALPEMDVTGDLVSCIHLHLPPPFIQKIPLLV